MTLARCTVPARLRMLALAALMGASFGVHADDYGDVTQLLRAGKTSEALARADQYLAGKPKDPQMRFIKGVIQSEAGKPNDAINTFTALTQEFPELPEPYNNLAVLYASQNQYDKARTALEMAIRTNPSYATAHENLGDVYAKLASQAYSKALQLDSSNTAAIQPKLALIRDLFTPTGKPGAKPATPTPAPAPAPVAAAPKPAPAPAPAPTPAPAPAAAAPSPAPAPSAAPAAAPTPAPAPAATAAPAPAPAAPAASGASGAEKDVEAAVRHWATVWSARDVSAYLAAYGKDFDPPGKMNRKAWEEERRARILGKARISVKLQDLSVSVSGGKATARFRQEYSADTLNVASRKTLDLVKAGDRWVIVRESTGG
ncbi:tetratricopeptide repeat protein [Curvibacter sp. HBC61]|uniref:Tetratricopeptide repeat protein n=1 Tax=Curvibacter cyanobacteriorum TaxID=3026422 RepID=A0ABT5MUR0_9BURK|nr:tetratricopeptide repeat protein [Curvibacter sp. HBC61]MDD0837084.1 tetratricopeptide repeat protein [Curvibacter sp. HBC61]